MTYNIIKTENYLLVVDDSEIKEGDWFYHPKYNEVGINYNPDGCKNIIAHLPLNNSPILDGVDLLPPLEDDVEKLGMHDLESYYGSNLELTASGRMWEDGFDIGYNKAKEKYKYTEEDLRKIFSRGWELRERYNGSDRNGYEENYPSNWKDMDYEERQYWLYEQELKSLSKYPIGFECEMEYDCCGRYQNCKGCDATAEMINVRLKTTTNLQGQTTWIGNYIY